jgi:hypothetical protein
MPIRAPQETANFIYIPLNVAEVNIREVADDWAYDSSKSDRNLKKVNWRYLD